MTLDILMWLNNGVEYNTNEPQHDKTNKMTCAPMKDSDQPGYPSSLIRVFIIRTKIPYLLSYPLNASEDCDIQADLSLRWAHSHFVAFVVLWLKSD